MISQHQSFQVRTCSMRPATFIGLIVLSSLIWLPSTLAQPITQPAKEVSQSETVFRFHLQSEPHSLDPAKLNSTDASYLFNNVMRGLYRYSNEKGLVPEGAKKCGFATPLRLICYLDAKARWNDGKPVVAEDYQRAFRHLLGPEVKNPGVELLKNVKNALAIHAGKQPADKLGVVAVKPHLLRIDFDRPDPDFLYKLTASLLAPVRSIDFPAREKAQLGFFNGPYKIVQWLPGRRIRLERNPHYWQTHPRAPSVEVLFIDEDETALNLFDKGTLTFLRRLPVHSIAKYNTHPGFRQMPVARFDYVGFGAELKDQTDLRAALALSADYQELQKIYNSPGIAGCTGLPAEFMDRPRCLGFDLDKAKMHWAKVPEDLKQKRLRMLFSKMGGDDVQKGAEWFQAQWKKNLGLTVDLEQTEPGVYLRTLQTQPPAIFRKGVGLERPTCLAALETFARDGSENFLSLKDEAYENILRRLAKDTDPRLCGEGVQFLLDRFLLIPLGRIHFTFLVDPRFTGWSLNEMNQLDLAGLRVQPRP